MKIVTSAQIANRPSAERTSSSEEVADSGVRPEDRSTFTPTLRGSSQGAVVSYDGSLALGNPWIGTIGSGVKDEVSGQDFEEALQYFLSLAPPDGSEYKFIGPKELDGQDAAVFGDSYEISVNGQQAAYAFTTTGFVALTGPNQGSVLRAGEVKATSNGSALAGARATAKALTSSGQHTVLLGEGDNGAFKLKTFDSDRGVWQLGNYVQVVDALGGSTTFQKVGGDGPSQLRADLSPVLARDAASRSQFLHAIATSGVPDAIIDQLGPKGAEAFRRLRASGSTDFADKQVAQDWLSVLTGAKEASTSGPWAGSPDVKRIVDNLQTCVLKGLAERAKVVGTYKSPAVSKALEHLERLSKGTAKNLTHMMDESTEQLPTRNSGTLSYAEYFKDFSQKQKDTFKAFHLGVIRNYNPEIPYIRNNDLSNEEKQLLLSYFSTPNRDHPLMQAQLELKQNAKASEFDVDFPALFAPPLTLNRPNGGDLSVSLAPNVPTTNELFVFSGDAKHTFSEAQQGEISQAITTFIQSDPTAWAQISSFVGEAGKIEIRANEGQGNQVKFLENNSPVLLLDYSEARDTLFKTFDNGLVKYGMPEIVWHELEHFGQFNQYGIFNEKTRFEALGGASPSDVLQLHFENEATARTNGVLGLNGKPLRTEYTQSAYIPDFKNGIEGATKFLNGMPLDTHFSLNEYAHATGNPEVLYYNGSSSLVSYLPQDPGAGQSGTLTFTNSLGQIQVL
jgi:hypothetical protein